MRKMATNDEKNLHAGHRERLRSQFRKGGFELLNEHQVLELMLSFVVPQKDTNPLAHMLINKFGSLREVIDAPYESLITVKGVGHVLAEFFNFESKLFNHLKSAKAQEENVYLHNTLQIIDFFKKTTEVGDLEKFYYIFLTSQGKMIKFGEMGKGDDRRVSLNNKEFINAVIKSNAHSVVICHTHPSGLATPSWQDRELTKSLSVTLRGIHVRLVDHIIVSHEGYYSFFQNKLLGN